MKKINELEKIVKDLNSYIEYCIKELEITEMNELYKTPEERINFLENSEKHFNANYKPLIAKGMKLYY